MPKYKVTAVMRTYLETEIEAADLDAAIEQAKELDGGNFKEQKDGKDWETFYGDIAEIEQ